MTRTCCCEQSSSYVDDLHQHWDSFSLNNLQHVNCFCVFFPLISPMAASLDPSRAVRTAARVVMWLHVMAKQHNFNPPAHTANAYMTTICGRRSGELQIWIDSRLNMQLLGADSRYCSVLRLQCIFDFGSVCAPQFAVCAMVVRCFLGFCHSIRYTVIFVVGPHSKPWGDGYEHTARSSNFRAAPHGAALLACFSVFRVACVPPSFWICALPLPVHAGGSRFSISCRGA